MLLRIWITSLVSLLCALNAQAQHWSFQMYGTVHGLTNPTILALHQDRQGFLWVSTEGGADEPVFAVAAGAIVGMFLNFSLSRTMVFR